MYASSPAWTLFGPASSRFRAVDKVKSTHTPCSVRTPFDMDDAHVFGMISIFIGLVEQPQDPEVDVITTHLGIANLTRPRAVLQRPTTLKHQAGFDRAVLRAY